MMAFLLWLYRTYIVPSGEFILSQPSAAWQCAAAAVVLLPFIALLVLCIWLLVADLNGGLR